MSVSSNSSATLVLLPTPGIGHLVPAMELAKVLVARDTRLTITVLLIKPPVTNGRLDSYTLSLKSDPSLLKIGITLIDISIQEPVLHKQGCITYYMEIYKSEVKDVVEGLQFAGPVGGLILDMFCPSMFDVGDDLGIPSYLFLTSGASLLTIMFHLRGLGVEGLREYDVVRSPDKTVDFAGFRNPVPVGVLPRFFLLENDGLRHVDTYRKAKGILVNTFEALERDLIHSLSLDNRIPPVIPVGPLINLVFNDDDDEEDYSSVMGWLDAQPPRSVVFLCFGSRGCFDDKQVKEIAYALERSGQRFLWSLRKSKGVGVIPLELDSHEGVLPDGFIERTTGRGRVIGWAPQARVLGHVAVGAFVSHCGWNSTLESLWYNVPMIVWPIGAEQHLNAFSLVTELRLATKIKNDYRQDFGINILVGAAEIEAGIKNVIDSKLGELVGKKGKEMSEEARKAVKEGGSSYEYVSKFIENVFDDLRKIS